MGPRTRGLGGQGGVRARGGVRGQGGVRGRGNSQALPGSWTRCGEGSGSSWPGAWGCPRRKCQPFWHKGGVGGLGYLLYYKDQYWSRGERVPVPCPSWVLPTSGLQEAGKRPGSTFAIEVEGLKRRPPSVGGRPRP